MQRGLAIALASSLCAACAEHTLVRSRPPGATLHVNGKLVGVTPVEYSVSRAEFDGPLRFRLEHEGYQPLEGELRKRVGPARIISGFFSAGVSLIFKRPTTLRDRYEYVLVPAPPP